MVASAPDVISNRTKGKFRLGIRVWFTFVVGAREQAFVVDA